MQDSDTQPPSWHLVHLVLDEQWRSAAELATRVEGLTGDGICTRTIQHTLQQIRASDENGIEYRNTVQNGTQRWEYRTQ